MIKFEIVPISLLAVIALSACGGGSSGGGTLALLNIGTTSTTTSPNGLPFAGPGTNFADEFDQEGRVLMAIRSGDGAIQPMRVDLAYVDYATFAGDPAVSGDEVITLEIGGRVLNFESSEVDARFPYVATLDGVEYALSLNPRGRFSNAMRVSVLDRPDGTPFGIYAFGLQTNPAALPSGIATYVGQLRGFAIESDRPEFVGVIDGGITFDVDFASSGISGTGRGHLNGDSFRFDMDATEIVGNGFSSTLTFDCPAINCESRSQIGGAFFGGEGQEISGLILLDETIATYADGLIAGQEFVEVIGAAGYTAMGDDGR